MKKIPLLPHLCLFLFILYFNGSNAQESGNPDNENSTTSKSTSNFYTSQSKTQNAFDGLGYYNLYNYNLNYTNNKLNLTLGAGLLEQNTIFNNSAPGFYGSFSANFEYKINHRYSFYLFGRYITPSLNEEERVNTPHMLHIFPQTEIRAGLRGNFNNLNIDVGAGTIFENELSHQKPNSIINSRISIGF
jgi:hypothetical protein